MHPLVVLEKSTLRRMKEDRFIAASRDLDTILSSFLCSCILFAIVEQLVKRLFHSSRVKFLWSESLRVDVWCQRNGFGSWGPN